MSDLNAGSAAGREPQSDELPPAQPHAAHLSIAPHPGESPAVSEFPADHASAIWLADAEDDPAPPPGPGLGEAVGWTVGAGVVHMLAAIVISVVLLVAHIANHGLDSANEMGRFADSLLNEYALALVGGDQALFLLAVVVAVTLRMGSPATRRLGWRPPAPLQLLLIVALTLPLSVLCTAIYIGAAAVWNELVVYLPALSFLDRFLAMEAIKPLAAGTSLPVLIVAIAVLPALSEELLFRGLIGRGLVARWGLARGVLFTSVLFGMIHIHPAHAVAVIPLGIALHLVYYATRSFWAPILLHFSNNAWAAYNAKAGSTPDVDSVLVAGLLLVTAIAAAAATFWLLLKIRVQYTHVDGTPWNPGYPTLDVPPASALRQVPGAPGSATVGTCLSSGLAFAVVFASWWTASS